MVGQQSVKSNEMCLTLSILQALEAGLMGFSPNLKKG
jgi:hypothetical protein